MSRLAYSPSAGGGGGDAGEFFAAVFAFFLAIAFIGGLIWGVVFLFNYFAVGDYLQAQWQAVIAHLSARPATESFAIAVLVSGVLAALAMLVATTRWVAAFRGEPLRRVWIVFYSAARTFIGSVLRPSAIGFIMVAVAFVALAGLFQRPELGWAISSGTFTPLTPESLRLLGAAVALGAAYVSITGLAGYVFAGRDAVRKALSAQIPSKREVAESTESYLHFYHGLLKFSSVMAFLYELAFQTVLFGLFIWGVAIAFPSLALFVNPSAMTIPAVILFWVDVIFSLVDGQRVFGLRFSPLEANSGAWAFGSMIVFFKVALAGLILRLINHSFGLRPEDISPEWGKALK